MFVLRNPASGGSATWVEVPARELVPGDLVQIKEGMHVCSDCVLVRGNAVVNESSLTGQLLKKLLIRSERRF